MSYDFNAPPFPRHVADCRLAAELAELQLSALAEEPPVEPGQSLPFRQAMLVYGPAVKWLARTRAARLRRVAQHRAGRRVAANAPAQASPVRIK